MSRGTPGRTSRLALATLALGVAANASAADLAEDHPGGYYRFHLAVAGGGFIGGALLASLAAPVTPGHEPFPRFAPDLAVR
ncbi:MAG: hypothetical protein ABW217_22635, partial [Polyangiaceae bacterium]